LTFFSSINFGMNLKPLDFALRATIIIKLNELYIIAFKLIKIRKRY